MQNDNPSTDFTKPETFKFIMDFDGFIKKLYPILAVACILGFVIMAALFNAIGIPAPALFALVGAVALGYFMYQARKKQYDRDWSNATMTFSPEGIVSQERAQTVTLPWNKIRGFGLGGFVGPAQVPGLAMSDSARAATEFSRKTSASPQVVLEGFGDIVLKDDAPALSKMALEQQLQRVEKDEDGKPLCVAVISYYEKDWKNGQIGEWINHYRPDLKDKDQVLTDPTISN